MQLFSSVPAFSIRSFTPQIFNSFYFSNPIFYNLQDSKILLALLSEDFTRELGSIDDYKPACCVCVGQIRTLGWCPWSRSTTRRIFFESSRNSLGKSTPPSSFPVSYSNIFPPELPRLYLLFMISLFTPFLLSLSFFLSLLVDLVLYPCSFFCRICPDTEANLYETARNYWRASLSPFLSLCTGSGRGSKLKRGACVCTSSVCGDLI